MSDDDKKIYSVTSLNREVRGSLERSFGDIWLEAEVVKAKVYSSGHLYFELCDPGGKAQINGVMWRTNAFRYAKLVKAGTSIRCFGTVTLYEAGGRFQFVAKSVSESKEGLKAKAFLELKALLHKEGLFAPEKKRAIPQFPRCVGVVSSRQGAALQDIIKVASRRYPVKMLLAHAAVQGAQAPKEIVAAIEFLGSRSEIDLMIVGRGGGGSDDLDAFNNEAVVRAVAACRVPVICAVGHQVDVSLAELAADRRAATPSEAAELAVPDIEEVAGRLNDLKRRMFSRVKIAKVESRNNYFFLKNRLGALDPRVRLGRQKAELLKLNDILNRWQKNVIQQHKSRVVELNSKLVMWSKTALNTPGSNLASASMGIYSWPEPATEKLKGRFGQAVTGLNALSPLASLGRGYSILKDKNGVIVKDAAALKKGDLVNVKLHKGRISAEVKSIESE